jgi:hypothetical protein
VSVRSARYNLLSLRNPKGLTVIPEERDAWAFLDAAGITSSRQQRAVIELVRGLKHAQLWTKMKAIYPFVGGTATTHKYNLKDPRDADAAFRLSFSGGWTHASTGALPNGTNAYADTFFAPNSQMSSSSSCTSIYSRTDSNNTATDIGVWGSQSTIRLLISTRFSGVAYGDCYNLSTNRASGTVANSIGYYVLNRSSSTLLKFLKNNIQIGSNVTGSSSGITQLTNALLIGAQRDTTGISGYSNREFAFATLGDGLTDTDATNLYNIVQRFQTSLGRQV